MLNSNQGLVSDLLEGQDLFREYCDHSLVFQDSIKVLESLIIYSCSKCVAKPSRWIAELIAWMLSSLCHSWGYLKLFSLSGILDWKYLVHIWLCKDEFCTKDEFLFEYWHLSYPGHQYQEELFVIL